MSEVTGYQIWVTWVIWCFTKKLCTRRDAWAGALSWWSCQSPVAHCSGLLNHLNIFCGGECSNLMHNLMQIHCSTCSVILSVMTTQYTCSLNDVYRPHWLGQWSRHCSQTHIPVPSPWLPGYIKNNKLFCYVNNGWTFSRQTLYVCIYVYMYVYL